jgi:hypothetical protein
LREVIFSHGMTAKVKNIFPNLRGATITEGGTASPKTMRISSPKAQISCCEGVRDKLPDQRVERKAPWEPRSFTDDNAFHHVPGVSYGRGKGVGRGLGAGPILGVGVGRGVAVGVALAVAVGVAVAVAVAVAVGVDVAVAVAVAVGVGVGEPPPKGPWIATVVGDPVLK